MEEKYLTLAEASKLPGVDYETLKKRCQKKSILGARKKGRLWLVPVKSVLQDGKPSVGVYVDGSNIYHGGKLAGWQVDYLLLKDFIERKYEISIISYYNSTGYKQGQNGEYQKDKAGKYILDEGALKFESILNGLGIRVVTKPLKFIKGNEQNPSSKTDGDLMIDAVLETRQWDELILFAGDCDYERLVKHISGLLKPVHIFSFRSRISHELRVLALNSPYVTYTKIDDLKSAIKYDKDQLQLPA